MGSAENKIAAGSRRRQKLISMAPDCLTRYTVSFMLIIRMFVSVMLDPGGVETSKSLSAALIEFGFTKVQRACWETASMSPEQFDALKKNVDALTDYYDTVRFYQFPCDGQLVVTELHQKKWRRFTVHSQG